MRVFLSYRRSDVGGRAGRLSDELVRQFGPRDVFHDVSTIAPGEHFPAAIERALTDCDVVLAVIGPTWLAAATPEGIPRLLQSDDYVRLELETALAMGRTIMPVLVGGAALPAADDLPEALRPLALRQAVTLHDETWHEDVAGLLRWLRGDSVFAARRSRLSTTSVAAAVALIALAALGAGAWWWLGGGGTDDGDPVAALSPCASPSGDGWTALTLADDPTGELLVEGGSLQFGVREGWWRARAPGAWEVLLRTRMDNLTGEEQYHGDWLYDALIVGRTAADKRCFSPNPELVRPDTAGDALLGYAIACAPQAYIRLVLSGDEDRLDVTSEDAGTGDC